MLSPAPVLLDMQMPGISGLETLAMLHERNITWPVIAMTAHGDMAIAVKAMKLGAIDFLEKPFRADMLDLALSQAFEAVTESNDVAVLQSRIRTMLQTLSCREREVLAILVAGLSNKLAAHRLGLSIRTIEMHRRNALAKLGIKNLTEAVALVASAGSMASGSPSSDVLHDLSRTLRNAVLRLDN